MNEKTAELIASFLRIAREDLEGARLLASVDNRNAIYLCEQAAEKIIRAVVTAEGRHVGHRHALATTVDEHVPDENPLKPALAQVTVLEAYATAYRYPTPTGRVPAPLVGERFAALLTQVQDLLMEAARLFAVDLQSDRGPARKPQAPR